MNDISLCVFLGNPGRTYIHTRHNIGFMLAEYLPQAREASWQQKFHGDYASILESTRKLDLLKPQTFMNKSGVSVAAAATFFKIPVQSILVVHDELELPFGTIGFRRGGGLGGHNGLRSVAERLGSKDFARLRIGIGRPPGGSVSSYVLSQFNSEEKISLGRVLEEAAVMFDNIVSGSYTGEIKQTIA